MFELIKKLFGVETEVYAENEKPLIILWGGSGSGKSTVAEILSEKYNDRIIESYTDRPERFYGEKGHIFLSKNEFSSIRRRQMAAYTKFDGHRYCSTLKQIMTDDVYIVDPSGIKFLKKVKKNGRIKREFLIVHLKVSENICAQRMKERGDSEEKIQGRLKNDRKMFWNVPSDLTIDAETNDANTVAKRIHEKVLEIINK